MSDANPYSTPGAELSAGAEELYQPKIFSFQGRLGRMRYIAYGIGINFLLMIVMVPLIGASAMMTGDASGMSGLGFIAIGIFYIATFVISIMFGKRRLNDLNRSGWWFLLFIIPLVNLALVIYLLFFPGTDGSNNFGAAPVANTVGVLILGWMLPVLFFGGIIAAIAIPALMGVGP